MRDFEQLPYIVDLWAEDELTVSCLAKAAERTIALMAFDAAAVSYPQRVVTVRGPGLNETYPQPPEGSLARGHARTRHATPSGLVSAMGQETPHRPDRPEPEPPGMLDRGGGEPDRNSEIQKALAEYLGAAQGDAQRALRTAIADLMDLSDEAEFRKQVLDQWTSLGYVRGRASTILAVQAGSRRRNAE